jgi:hypothetical protein
MLEHGRFDTTSVRKLQASVAQGKVLLVTDLQDTWIFPFTSAAQRERAIDSVLNRAPFLITSQSVYYVAYSPADFGDKLVVGDFDITVVSREVAKSIIASAIAD